MKQCVAPVSSKTVTRQGPCAVQRYPDRRGLKVWLPRAHAWNSGIAVRVARRACQAVAKSSTDTLSAVCAATSSSSACCGLHPAGLGPPRPQPPAGEACRALRPTAPRSWGLPPGRRAAGSRRRSPLKSLRMHLVPPGRARSPRVALPGDDMCLYAHQPQSVAVLPLRSGCR